MATINVADKIAQIGKATEKAAQDVELLSKAWATVQMAFNGFGGASNTISNAVDKVKSDISQQITDIDTLVKQKMDEIGSSGATTGLVETTKDKVTKSVSESPPIVTGKHQILHYQLHF